MLALILLSVEDFDTSDNVTLLYRKYAKLLYKVAYNVVKIHEDAEDAVSDAFASLIKRGTLLPADDPRARAQLIVAVRNCAINIRRRELLRAHVPEEDMQAVSDHIPPDEEVIIADAIARLPIDLSELLVLYYFDGYTTKEIAGMKDLKQDTVQKKLKKSRQMLKKMLTEEV